MERLASYANLFPTERSLVPNMTLEWVARYAVVLLVFVLISWGLRFFVFQGMREKVAKKEELKKEEPKKKNKFFRLMREKAEKKEKDVKNRRYRKR